MLAVALTVVALGTVDRTGRHATAGRHSKVAEGVRTITMQVGSGKGGSSKSDIHLRWEKDFLLRDLRARVTAKTSWPRSESFDSYVGKDGALDTISVGGSVRDVVYQATHADGATDIQLAFSLPGGLQLMSAVNVQDGGQAAVKSVSAFHTAGAFNLQPTWFLPDKRLRIKLGKGLKRFACPVSLTTELRPGEGLGDASYEVGVRQQLSPGRTLRARLLLPPTREERKVWAEIRDSAFDPEALWILKATVPMAAEAGSSLSDCLRAAEFVMRRAWQF